MAEVIKRHTDPIIVSGHTLVMISFLILAHSSLLPRYCDVRTKDAIKKAKVTEPDKRRGKLERSLDENDLEFVADDSVGELVLILSTIYPWNSFLFLFLIL
jgi:hypothetical protein